MKVCWVIPFLRHFKQKNAISYWNFGCSTRDVIPDLSSPTPTSKHLGFMDGGILSRHQSTLITLECYEPDIQGSSTYHFFHTIFSKPSACLEDRKQIDDSSTHATLRLHPQILQNYGSPFHKRNPNYNHNRVSNEHTAHEIPME